jgi:hypothetical protein
MTKQTGDAAGPLVPSARAQADPEMQAIFRNVIGCLTLARDAMKLAIRAADEAAHEATPEQPTPAQALAGWRSANLLVRTAFGGLHSEVRNAIDVMEIMLRPG